MEVTGSIVQICTRQENPKKDGSGVWVQQTFVIQTEGQYPKKVPFLIKGEEKVENFNKYNKEGKRVTVKFDAEGREYNGKWYTDLTAYRIDTVKSEQTQQPTAQVPVQSSISPAEGDKDDLPF